MTTARVSSSYNGIANQFAIWFYEINSTAVYAVCLIVLYVFVLEYIVFEGDGRFFQELMYHVRLTN